jgi:predicted ArsR family transcriptional regulator
MAEKEHTYLEMNPAQVRNILKHIDATQSEAVKDNIFSQLGHECFHAGAFAQWIEPYKENVQVLLDEINIEGKSPYWERLEFSEDRTMLILIGRKVQNCACSFADCPEPPKSLCHYCCKNFQQVLFADLLGRKVEVDITEAYLLGGERCSTNIRLVETV